MQKISENLRMLPDGSIEDNDGAIVWFSVDRFYKDICLGNCCLLCGASPKERDFNDEHIIPDWLLRKHRLHEQKITLPNRTKINYAQYKVPCCVDCNSLMGKRLEKPVSEVLSLPYDKGAEVIMEGFWYQLMVWLHLMFLKTHLKDTSLRLHRDERQPFESIATLFDLKSLHHCHCIVRSYFNNTKLGQGTIPSIKIYPCTEDFADQFDYVDLTECLIMGLHSGEYMLIMALDDAGMARAAAEPMLSGIDGPINPLQFREILARIGFANLWLEHRPQFFTKFTSPPEIVAEVPSKLSVVDRPRTELGYLIASLTHHYVQLSKDPEAELRKLRQGKTSFLYDETGEFSSASLRLENCPDKTKG